MTGKLVGAAVGGAVGYFLPDAIEPLLAQVPIPDNIKDMIRNNKIMKYVVALVGAIFLGPLVAGFVNGRSKSWAKLRALGGVAFRAAQEFGINLPIPGSGTGSNANTGNTGSGGVLA